jgi:type IV secretory pathway TrbD component
MLILCGIACVTMGLALNNGWLIAGGVVCALMAHVGNVLDCQPDPNEPTEVE